MGCSAYQRGKATAYIGAAHASDIAEFYGFGTQPDLIGMDAISKCLLDPLHSTVDTSEVNFTNTPDPNTKNMKSLLFKINRPLWESSAVAPLLFTFVDPAPSVNVTFDNFRTKEIELLITIALKLFG
jgi:acetylcholinesterase